MLWPVKFTDRITTNRLIEVSCRPGVYSGEAVLAQVHYTVSLSAEHNRLFRSRLDFMMSIHRS